MKKRPRILSRKVTYAKNGKTKNRDVCKITMKGVSLSGQRIQLTLRAMSLDYKWCKRQFIEHLRKL